MPETQNLCIDRGNTRTKAAIFCEKDLQEMFVFDNSEDLGIWQEIFEKYAIDNTIISTVGAVSAELLAFLQEKSERFVQLTHQTPTPIRNLYQSPETLGKDRLAALAGALSLAPQHRGILVIDAGTAITYDFLNERNEYHGGNISPGMSMRFRALHQFTDRLPLVNPTDETAHFGSNTHEAIQHGTVNGIIHEMEGYIDRQQKLYPDVLIFLTGGDCFFFEKKLKNVIFANANLVLTGLNEILNYQANVKM